MKRIHHFTALLIITSMMGLIYASIQQVYRSNANDPQVQMVRDLKALYQNGKKLPDVFSDSVDIEKSLSVFVETYDNTGKPIQSSGYLQGRLPQLPLGVLDYARKNGEHWVTWQPQPHVRMAMGIAHVNVPPVAFVAAGRSLQQVEERESQLVKMILTAWVFGCGIVLVNWFIVMRYNSKLNEGGRYVV